MEAPLDEIEKKTMPTVKDDTKVIGTLQATDVRQVAARAAKAATRTASAARRAAGASMGGKAMSAAGWGVRPPGSGAAYIMYSMMLPLCHESERFEGTLDGEPVIVCNKQSWETKDDLRA